MNSIQKAGLGILVLGLCVCGEDTFSQEVRDPLRASCVGEGGSIPVVPNAPSCCEGLSIIRPRDERILGSQGICTSGCGNGVCDPEDPFSDSIWERYDHPVNVPGWEGTDWHTARPLVKYAGTAYRMYLYRFKKNGRPVYTGWFDCFNVRECSVMKINTAVELDFDRNTKHVKITKAVPKHQSGKTAIESETKTANDGKVTIFLREVPVFVEAE